jgi:hypothetical protein
MQKYFTFFTGYKSWEELYATAPCRIVLIICLRVWLLYSAFHGGIFYERLINSEVRHSSLVIRLSASVIMRSYMPWWRSNFCRKTVSYCWLKFSALLCWKQAMCKSVRYSLVRWRRNRGNIYWLIDWLTDWPIDRLTDCSIKHI